MGVFWKLFFAIVIGYLANCAYQAFNSEPTIPDIPIDKNYWGPGEPKKDDETIIPFKINVSDKILADLKTRLDMELRLQPSLEKSNFEYGFGSEVLERVVKYWNSDQYNWRSREKILNSLPQYMTQIFGLNIHFIHAKPTNVPKNVKVLPLILLHGWPGSVKEFYGIIPILTTPNKDRDFVFEVIAPSLPGYAFSEGSQKRGLSPAHVAVMMKQLMSRLGHQQFYMQGGDWGSLIATITAIIYPNNVEGIHLTMCSSDNGAMANFYLWVASFYPSLFMDQQLSDHLYPMSDFFSNMILESGYFHLQATKPDTVGVGLNNSPAGLAAYILEKFSTWTNMENRFLPDGGLEKKFKLADLLDNVMLYWVTGSITSSMRIYSECLNKQYMNIEKWDSVPVHVPTFCATFPHELMLLPDFMIRQKYKNLVLENTPLPTDPLYKAVRPPRGGHFPAFEEPQLLADSVFTAVTLMRNKKIKM